MEKDNSDNCKYCGSTHLEKHTKPNWCLKIFFLGMILALFSEGIKEIKPLSDYCLYLQFGAMFFILISPIGFLIPQINECSTCNRKWKDQKTI